METRRQRRASTRRRSYRRPAPDSDRTSRFGSTVAHARCPIELAAPCVEVRARARAPRAVVDTTAAPVFAFGLRAALAPLVEAIAAESNAADPRGTAARTRRAAHRSPTTRTPPDRV